MTYPTKKLEEVASLVRGPFGGSLKKEIFIESGDCVYEQGNVIDNNIESFRYFVTVEKFEQMKRFAVSSGDILMSCSGTIGKFLIIPKIFKRGIINQALLKITPNQKITVEYLKYALQEYLSSNSTHVKGMAIKNIASVKELKNLKIPLPPLEIQKKIVERVERLMRKIDEAKKLRKEAMADASSLIPSALNKIFSPHTSSLRGKEGKKKGWEEKTIGEISEKTKRINPIEFFDKEFSYIDITSVSKSIDFAIRARILSVNKAPSRARNLVKEGDIIFATTRPYLKNIVMIPKNLSGSVASTGFCVIRPNKKIVDSSYIYYVVDSEYFLSKIIPLQRGATYPAVSDTDIYNQKIPLPPLPEQQKIVKYLDSLSEKVRKIQTLQLATERELKLLEKSVLKEAFDG